MSYDVCLFLVISVFDFTNSLNQGITSGLFVQLYWRFLMLILWEIFDLCYILVIYVLKEQLHRDLSVW